MSHFIFKAKKSSGETYTAEKDAADRYELYRLIRESGDEIISVSEKKGRKGTKAKGSTGFLSGHVKSIEKINFARNLGSMLRAGLPLSRALSVLERQSHNKTFKAILAEIIADVGRGLTFADALGKHTKVFPPIFVSMVHAGEQSGSLSDSLRVVAAQLESSFALTRRVRGALIYPAVIICVMLLIAVLMFIFVIPTLLKTFTDLHVTLPFATRVILGISDVLQHDGIFVLVGLVALFYALRAWGRTAKGKKIVHSALLKMPLFGGLVQEVNAARTARTLSSLIEAGVDVVEALSITGEVIQNVRFKAVLAEAEEAIKRGDLMSKVFASHPKLYPIFLSEMISVGEETGKTDEMLLGVAKYYEDDVEQKTKDMSTVIEPLIMVVIAAGVGFFAVAMISPMYSLVNAI